MLHFLLLNCRLCGTHHHIAAAELNHSVSRAVIWSQNYRLSLSLPPALPKPSLSVNGTWHHLALTENRLFTSSPSALLHRGNHGLPSLSDTETLSSLLKSLSLCLRQVTLDSWLRPAVGFYFVYVTVSSCIWGRVIRNNRLTPTTARLSVQGTS